MWTLSDGSRAGEEFKVGQSPQTDVSVTGEHHDLSHDPSYKAGKLVLKELVHQFDHLLLEIKDLTPLQRHYLLSPGYKALFAYSGSLYFIDEMNKGRPFKEAIINAGKYAFVDFVTGKVLYTIPVLGRVVGVCEVLTPILERAEPRMGENLQSLIDRRAEVEKIPGLSAVYARLELSDEIDQIGDALAASKIITGIGRKVIDFKDNYVSGGNPICKEGDRCLVDDLASLFSSSSAESESKSESQETVTGDAGLSEGESAADTTGEVSRGVVISGSAQPSTHASSLPPKSRTEDSGLGFKFAVGTAGGGLAVTATAPISWPVLAIGGIFIGTCVLISKHFARIERKIHGSFQKVYNHAVELNEKRDGIYSEYTRICAIEDSLERQREFLYLQDEIKRHKDFVEGKRREDRRRKKKAKNQELSDYTDKIHREIYDPTVEQLDRFHRNIAVNTSSKEELISKLDNFGYREEHAQIREHLGKIYQYEAFIAWTEHHYGEAISLCEQGLTFSHGNADLEQLAEDIHTELRNASHTPPAPEETKEEKIKEEDESEVFVEPAALLKSTQFVLAPTMSIKADNVHVIDSHHDIPSTFDAVIELAESYYHDRQYDEVLRVISIAEKQFKGCEDSIAKLNELKGNILAVNGNFEQAIPYLEQASELTDHRKETTLNLIDCYFTEANALQQTHDRYVTRVERMDDAHLVSDLTFDLLSTAMPKAEALKLLQHYSSNTLATLSHYYQRSLESLSTAGITMEQLYDCMDGATVENIEVLAQGMRETRVRIIEAGQPSAVANIFNGLEWTYLASRFLETFVDTAACFKDRFSPRTQRTLESVIALKEQYLTPTITVYPVIRGGYQFYRYGISPSSLLHFPVETMISIPAVQTLFFGRDRSENVGYVPLVIGHFLRALQQGTVGTLNRYLQFHGSTITRWLSQGLKYFNLENTYVHYAIDAAVYMTSVCRALTIIVASLSAIDAAKVDDIQRRVSRALLLSQSSDSSIKLEAAFMFQQIKRDIEEDSTLRTHCWSLYVLALACEYYQLEKFKFSPSYEGENNIFHAVATYIDKTQTPAQLKEKTAEYLRLRTVEIAERVLALKAAKFPENHLLELAALEAVLNRPIVVIGSQHGVCLPPKVPCGNPIFIYFDNQNQTYQGLIVFEKYFIEEKFDDLRGALAEKSAAFKREAPRKLLQFAKRSTYFVAVTLRDIARKIAESTPERREATVRMRLADRVAERTGVEVDETLVRPGSFWQSGAMSVEDIAAAYDESCTTIVERRTKRQALEQRLGPSLSRHSVFYQRKFQTVAEEEGSFLRRWFGF